VPTATDDSNSQSQGRIEDDIYTHPTETHAQVQDSTADGTYQPSFAYYKDVVPVYSKPNSITPNRVQLQAWVRTIDLEVRSVRNVDKIVIFTLLRNS
jgi:hypothetical protein